MGHGGGAAEWNEGNLADNLKGGEETRAHQNQGGVAAAERTPAKRRGGRGLRWTREAREELMSCGRGRGSYI